MQIDAVTESTLLQLRSLPDETAATFLDNRLRVLEAQWRRSFYERGVILHEVKQRLLWRFVNDCGGVPYTSFDRWLLEAAPQSRSDCYAALKVVEELRDIPRHELESVPRCNLHILQALSSNIRQNSEVLHWASTTSQKDFVARIEYAFPDQHIESRRMIHLNPTTSLNAVMQQGIELAKRVEQVTTREEAIEAIFMEYIHAHQEAEDGEAQAG